MARTALPGRKRAIAKLKAMDNVRVLSRTTAFGYYAQNFVGLVERVSDHLQNPGRDLPRERLWQVRAKRVVLATGAIERHMVFADNDRPGIMLASAARTYLNHYGVAVGKNVGVYTANDSAYAAAIDLKKAGVNIAAIVDLRDNPTGPVIDEARALGIEINFGRAVIRAGGKLRVTSMTVQPKNGGGERTIPVDAILMSAGWTPSVHLFSQSRGKVAFNDETKRFVPGTYAQDCVSVGACNGTDGLAATIDEAYAAGAKAAKDAGAKAAKGTKPKVDAGESWSRGMLGAAPGAGPDTTVKAFVDFQNDVTAKDIRQAVHEGMRSIEHVKRFTTNGMATDQGKTSNMHGLAIAAETLGKPIPEVGLTTFRAPYTPVTFGAIVGHARGSAVRSDAQDRDPSLGRSAKVPCSRMSASGSAPGISRRAARTCMPPSTANASRVRNDGRPVRCLDARQDRGGRAGCGEVHGAALHQSVGEAGARPLPLWHHAARGRLHL